MNMQISDRRDDAGYDEYGQVRRFRDWTNTGCTSGYGLVTTSYPIRVCKITTLVQIYIWTL